MFRTSFYLKAASARKEDSIDTVHPSNDSQDDKFSTGVSFIAIMILGVLENIFEICPFKRTNLNSVGLGGLNRTHTLFQTKIKIHTFRNPQSGLGLGLRTISKNLAIYEATAIPS